MLEDLRQGGSLPLPYYPSFIENDSTPSDTFDPSWLMEPAYGDFARRRVTLDTSAGCVTRKGVTPS